MAKVSTNATMNAQRARRWLACATFICATIAAPTLATAQSGAASAIPQARAINLDELRAEQEPRCNAGNYTACFGLGWSFYLYGRTPQEEAQGITWMRRACAGGNTPACRMMPR